MTTSERNKPNEMSRFTAETPITAKRSVEVHAASRRQVAPVRNPI